jgi:hypothetical protein
MLRRFTEQAEDRIRIAELTCSFGDRTFGALLLIFAIPNLVPLPPGSSTVLGLPLILVAAQLALGRDSLWLPQAVGNRSLAKRDLQRVVDCALPPLRWTERLLAPRLEALLPDRLIGAACLILAVILALPIPFGNMPPAFAICAFALGLLQRDGLAGLVGWLATLASLVIVTLVSGAVVLAAKAAFEVIMSFVGGPS